MKSQEKHRLGGWTDAMRAKGTRGSGHQDDNGIDAHAVE